MDTTTLIEEFEEWARVADAGEQHGRETKNTHLETCSKAEAKVWRRAAAMVRAMVAKEPPPA